MDGRPDPERLGRITLMPQSDALLPWRTLLDNVAPGRRAWAACPEPRRDRAARRALARMGLGGIRGALPPRALGRHAPARGAGAHAARRRRGCGCWTSRSGHSTPSRGPTCRACSAAAWRESAPTVLLVTHDLEEAILLADRVLVSGPRPARVVDEVAGRPAAAPRPRRTRARPEFGELRGRVLDGLRSAGALA